MENNATVDVPAHLQYSSIDPENRKKVNVSGRISFVPFFNTEPI